MTTAVLTQKENEYLGNALHIFEQKSEKLFNTDKMIGSAIGFTLFCWLSGSISLPLTLTGFVGSYLASQHLKRPEQNAEFATALKELVTAYRVICLRHGTQATQDPTLLNALRKIAPYVTDTTLLMPWNLNHLDSTQDLSKDFEDILSQAPHRIQLIRLKPEASALSSMLNIFSNQENPQPPEQKSPKIAPESKPLQYQVKTLFAQSRAEFNQYVYGNGIEHVPEEALLKKRY